VERGAARLRQENFKPNRDLILALTAARKPPPITAARNGLLTNRPRSVNAKLCLNADAGGPQIRHGKYSGVFGPGGRKNLPEFPPRSEGAGGHSSLPTPDNPIYRLAAGLMRLPSSEFPARLSEITRGYFQKMSAIETGQTAADMQAILKTPPDPDALKRLSASPVYNATLRTTAVATMLDGGHAENALAANGPGQPSIAGSCRTNRPKKVAKTLRRVLADDQISITPIEPAKPSPASPLNTGYHASPRAGQTKSMARASHPADNGNRRNRWLVFPVTRHADLRGISGTAGDALTCA